MFLRFVVCSLFVLILGCQGGGDSLQLNEKMVYKSDMEIYRLSISPDQKVLYVLQEDGIKFIDSNTGSVIGSHSDPNLSNIIWSHSYEKYIIQSENGQYYYSEMGKDLIQLEENLWPTSWSIKGDRFFAYKGEELYEVKVPSFIKRKITMEESFVYKVKKVLFDRIDGIKIVEYDTSSILVLDKNNNVIHVIDQYIQDSLKLSPDGKKVGFLRRNPENEDENILLIYNLVNNKVSNLAAVNGFNLIWSPKSDKLLVHDSVNIQLVDLATSDLELFNYDTDEHILGLAWIAGDKVALYKREFYLMFSKDWYKIVDLINGNEVYAKRVKNVGGGYLHWSQDGKDLYYKPYDDQGERIIKHTFVEDQN
jgi:hypothetical protein